MLISSPGKHWGFPYKIVALSTLAVLEQSARGLEMRFLSKTRYWCNLSSARLSTRSGAIFSVRSMESSDTPQVHGLLAKEGWVMEKAYLDCAFKTDPRGFVVAETPSRKIIGCHGFLAHGPSIASMGLWIVDRESQANRVGHQMFSDLAQRFSAGTNIGTFVWPHNVDRIKDQYGISVHKSYMTWYNYGQINPDTLKPCTDERFRILPASGVDMADILSYDAEIHQIPREAYIQNWIQHEQSKTYVALRNNKVCGYGVLRSQDSFNQIAPLYADNKHIAKAIIRHLAKHVPGQTVGFSSPLENSSAIAFAEANHMMKCGRPLLMILYKNKIDIDTDRVYAVSSNSFGNC